MNIKKPLSYILENMRRRFFSYMQKLVRKLVQGEYMENEEVVCKLRKKHFFPGGILFFAGFLAGMLIPNLGYRFQWKQQAFSAIYLLEMFGRQVTANGEYLAQIIQMRAGIYLLVFLCGFTVFGVPVAVLGMIFVGMGLGMVFAMSILQFGLAGLMVALGLLMPQYVFYLPVLWFLFGMVYEISLESWQSHSLFSKKTGEFLRKMLGYTFFYAIGIVVEWCINPWLLNELFEILNFF